LDFEVITTTSGLLDGFFLLFDPIDIDFYETILLVRRTGHVSKGVAEAGRRNLPGRLEVSSAHGPSRKSSPLPFATRSFPPPRSYYSHASMQPSGSCFHG